MIHAIRVLYFASASSNAIDKTSSFRLRLIPHLDLAIQTYKSLFCPGLSGFAKAIPPTVQDSTSRRLIAPISWAILWTRGIFWNLYYDTQDFFSTSRPHRPVWYILYNLGSIYEHQLRDESAADLYWTALNGAWSSLPQRHPTSLDIARRLTHAMRFTSGRTLAWSRWIDPHSSRGQSPPTNLTSANKGYRLVPQEQSVTDKPNIKASCFKYNYGYPDDCMPWRECGVMFVRFPLYFCKNGDLDEVRKLKDHARRMLDVCEVLSQRPDQDTYASENTSFPDFLNLVLHCDGPLDHIKGLNTYQAKNLSPVAKWRFFHTKCSHQKYSVAKMITEIGKLLGYADRVLSPDEYPSRHENRAYILLVQEVSALIYTLYILSAFIGTYAGVYSVCIAFILWLSDSNNRHRCQASWRSRPFVRLKQQLRSFGKQRMLCFLYVAGVVCMICAWEKGDCAYSWTLLSHPSRPTSKATAALQVAMDIPLEICNLLYNFVIDSGPWYFRPSVIPLVFIVTLQIALNIPSEIWSLVYNLVVDLGKFLLRVLLVLSVGIVVFCNKSDIKLFVDIIDQKYLR